MPLWTVLHGAGALDADDRERFAVIVTDLYSVLPRFYVAVTFRECAPGELYLGGEPAERFVRISVDHIARRLSTPELQEGWMRRLNAALVPFMAERSLSWEVHIDETSRELWSIDGLAPPPPGSAAEATWAQDNKPSPYEPVAP